MLSRIIKRPVAVTMLLLTLLVLGLTSLHRLPVSLIPDLNVPRITVQIDDATISATEMNERVLQPLMGRLQQIDGLEDISSEACDGKGRITLYFNEKSNMDYLFIEVNEKIDRSLSDIKGISRPKVLKTGASDIPAFYINIIPRQSSGSNALFADVSDFTRNVITKRFEQLDEVAMVDVSGFVSKEIHICPDMEALSRFGLSLNRFEELISSSNIRLGALSIHDGEYQYNVKFRSYATSAEDIANIWFKVGGKLLQLRDIASVELIPAPAQGLVFSDGHQAITMAIIKQSTARMSDLRHSVSALISRMETDYPDIRFTVTRDQTGLLNYSIKTLIFSIIIGIILAALIIVLFMGNLKSATLVIVTIPITIILSLLLFDILGISINIISLSGLLLGVGMMVDNSIILIDNITARRLNGDDLQSAVINGTNEVRGAMFSSVMTTCAVFLPILFINGTASAIFRDQALSITIILLTAWVVTTTVIPVLYYQWFNKNGRMILQPRKGKGDKKLMSFFISSPWLSLCLLVISAVGSVVLFSSMRKEKLPPITYTESILNIDWNEPLSLEHNTERVKNLENLIDNAKQVTSMVGAQQFILDHSEDIGNGEASIYMNFPSEESMFKTLSRIKIWISENFPNAVCQSSASGNLFEAIFSEHEAPLVVRLRPVKPEYLTLENLESVLCAISSRLRDPKIETVQTQSRIVYVADQAMMALYGISFPSLLDALRNAMGDYNILAIVQGGSSVPVVLGVEKASLTVILNETTVKSPYGADIPVSVLMKQDWENSIKHLWAGKEGNYYPINLYLPYSQIKNAMTDISETVRKEGHFEAGYSGSWFSNREMIKEMLAVFFIAVILLFLILAAQFESLAQPLIILSELVIDIFFCLLFLKLSGMGINIMTMIGIIVICGIVVNDSILKIDTTNKYRREGLPLLEAVMKASERRHKAIIMTSLTTILSVLPFLTRGNMGADLQYPMSIVIVIGMFMGTFVSIYIVPALYYSLYSHKR